MIEARTVSVRSRAALLLDGVSVSLPPGTVTAVLGPNGAGKTTLLRVLAGLLPPSRGSVTLGGAPLPPLATLARHRAVLGQHQPLEFGLAAADVVALGRLPHAGTDQARYDAAALLAAHDAFTLAPLWQRPYTRLSGGERQRVQLARVAAQLWRPPGDATPRALFLDEPTAALDLAQGDSALHFARAAAGQGVAVLAVLHDLNQAARADRIILLRDGRVLKSGPTDQVMRPDTLQACFGVPVELLRRADGRLAFLPA